MMNIKERVLSAIKFKGVDRIPAAYRGLECFSEKLMKYFEFKDYKNYEGHHKEFLKKLGADYWGNGWTPSNFSFFMPTCNCIAPETPYIKDSVYFYTLGLNAIVKTLDEYNYTYPNWVNPPLANIESENDLKEGFLTSKLDSFDFTNYFNMRLFETKESQKSHSKTGNIDYDSISYEKIKDSDEEFITIGLLNEPFILCCYLRGMESFLMDLAINKKLAEKLINEVAEFCIEFNRRELENFGDKAEWYGIWDDVAGQNGLLFDPELFHKYFYPIYNKLIENAKEYNLITSFHCCGSVHDILPSLIDAGLDVFNVVQTSAKDMELEKVYKRYGKNICFDGAIDVQKLLTCGKPEDIDEEVKKIVSLWGNDGGIIVAPSHEVLPETPIDNVITLYKALEKYS